jgi:hypothetical protein
MLPCEFARTSLMSGAGWERFRGRIDAAKTLPRTMHQTTRARRARRRSGPESTAACMSANARESAG